MSKKDKGTMSNITPDYVRYIQTLPTVTNSIYQPVTFDGEDTGEEFIDNVVEEEPSAEEILLNKEAFEILEKNMKKHLAQNQIDIIRMRYGLDTGEPMTFAEIAEVLGVSKQAVAEKEKKALRKLRTRLWYAGIKEREDL